MRSDAPTVDAYLEQLPDDRRDAIAAVRSTILEHLPEGFEEGMQQDDLIAAHERAHG